MTALAEEVLRAKYGLHLLNDPHSPPPLLPTSELLAKHMSVLSLKRINLSVYTSLATTDGRCGDCTHTPGVHTTRAEDKLILQTEIQRLMGHIQKGTK